MSAGDMIPYCGICHRRHYGADCPELPRPIMTHNRETSLKACHTTREVSHEEARQIAVRFIDANFGNPGEKPRIGIPARPDYDDDLLLHAYIDQQEARTTPEAAPASPVKDEVERIDTVMLGRFAAQYEEGAAGFFIDADEAQEVARQVKAALSLGSAIMDEVHNDLSIPTDVATKVYAAIKRANVSAMSLSPVNGEVERLREAAAEAKDAIEAACFAMVFDEPLNTFLHDTHEKLVAALPSPETQSEGNVK